MKPAGMAASRQAKVGAGDGDRLTVTPYRVQGRSRGLVGRGVDRCKAVPNLARLCYNITMTLTARVQNGRLILDEPTTLPEGQLVHLAVVEVDWSNEQSWTEAAREDLEAALAQGSDDVAAGRTVDAREFMASLPKRA